MLLRISPTQTRIKHKETLPACAIVDSMPYSYVATIDLKFDAICRDGVDRKRSPPTPTNCCHYYIVDQNSSFDYLPYLFVPLEVRRRTRRTRWEIQIEEISHSENVKKQGKESVTRAKENLIGDGVAQKNLIGTPYVSHRTVNTSRIR